MVSINPIYIYINPPYSYYIHRIPNGFQSYDLGISWDPGMFLDEARDGAILIREMDGNGWSITGIDIGLLFQRNPVSSWIDESWWVTCIVLIWLKIGDDHANHQSIVGLWQVWCHTGHRWQGWYIGISAKQCLVKTRCWLWLGLWQVWCGSLYP